MWYTQCPPITPPDFFSGSFTLNSNSPIVLYALSSLFLSVPVFSQNCVLNHNTKGELLAVGRDIFIYLFFLFGFLTTPPRSGANGKLCNTGENQCGPLYTERNERTKNIQYTGYRRCSLPPVRTPLLGLFYPLSFLFPYASLGAVLTIRW